MIISTLLSYSGHSLPACLLGFKKKFPPACLFRPACLQISEKNASLLAYLVCSCIRDFRVGPIWDHSGPSDFPRPYVFHKPVSQQGLFCHFLQQAALHEIII